MPYKTLATLALSVSLALTLIGGASADEEIAIPEEEVLTALHTS